jgi:hypothetical protein
MVCCVLQFGDRGVAGGVGPECGPQPFGSDAESGFVEQAQHGCTDGGGRGRLLQSETDSGGVDAGWAVSRILDSSSWFSWSGRCAGLVVGEGLGRGAVAQV